MSRRILRAVYAGLILMHPASFRARWGGEMLETFAAAAMDYPASWLLCDALVSLGKQWMLRTAPEPVTGSGLLAGNYYEIRATHLTPAKLTLALLLSLVSLLLFPPREVVPPHHPEILKVHYAAK